MSIRLIDNSSAYRYNHSKGRWMIMLLNDLLAEKKLSRYRLAKDSGVPQTTVVDICSGKAKIEKCSAGTLYRIAKALNVPMERLIEDEIAGVDAVPLRSGFEVFKNNIRHLVKDMGDLDFIIDILEKDEIRKLYDRKWYPESLYLLAMVDYLCRENDIPLCKNYNDIRAQKLKTVIYPSSVIAAASAMNDDTIKQESLKAAIPEFMQFNIVESEVRDVY